MSNIDIFCREYFYDEHCCAVRIHAHVTSRNDTCEQSQGALLCWQQHVPQSLMQSGIPVVYSSTCHNVELILQTDLPNVYSAFKVSGFSPAQVRANFRRFPVSFRACQKLVF